jgi:diguanylate cyclase (GGDEF)-like protein/PAS domain S-box-containing protein
MRHLADDEESRAAKRTLYRTEARLRGVLEASDAAFASIDAEGLILDWNGKAEDMFGWRREEAVGRALVETIGPRDPEAGRNLDLHDLVGDNGFEPETRLEFSVRHRSGREFPAELTVSCLSAGDERISQAFIRDLSPQREAEESGREAHERLMHQALHDPLTGLPNRGVLMEHLEHAVALAARNGTKVAVLFVDVDHIGVVNDSLGYHAGDQLLLAIAGRLRDSLRASDTVSRIGNNGLACLGGDEFAVVCENVTSPGDAAAAAARAIAAFEPPFQVAGERIFVTLSIGIAESGPGAGAESLLRDAGAAMHAAKERGRARHELFDPSMHDKALDRLTGENELRMAIERRELRLRYQPIVSVADLSLVGVEALVRWEHPRRGLLSPAEFLPLAERTGLIVPLGRWVFEEALAQAAAWHALPGRGLLLRMSVNVSGHQLARPELVDEIRELLEETGVAPSRLAIEVTETALMAELKTPVEDLRRLRELGVRIMLDDFGTGFSSLTYLRQLPLDAIKLDRSFVSQLDHSAADRQIVAAVIQLSKAMGMSAIAEGVETEAQLSCLRELGCHLAQGYYFARPMTAEQITAQAVAA